MMKKFVQGLFFGAGFCVSSIIIMSVWVSYLNPQGLDYNSGVIPSNTDEVSNFSSQETTVKKRDFRFFSDSTHQMKIPVNGGVLLMAADKSASNSVRPNTYQLWLTESGLWRINTVEEKVSIEELPYPEGEIASTLYFIMSKDLGSGVGSAQTTVHSDEIRELKETGDSWRSSRLNGQLKITGEGVVFIIPNPYET